MAGQKKEASLSILRRVTDRTPLHPARLENFRPRGHDAASFVARFLHREDRLIRRLLGVGGEFSPVRRGLGRGIVARFTEFNSSFGPVQRSLRPQPEHSSRRRKPLDAAESYDGYAPEDYGYEAEPAFFNRPELLNYQANFAAPAPALAPWENVLNAPPQPVARRIEFQPANLRALTDPESHSAFSPEQFERVPRPVSPPPQPELGPVERVVETRVENNALSSWPRQVQAQPALNRALQRAFDATVGPSGLATPFFQQTATANLGASPAAVARHFAVPATLARYRAVKQAADKVFFGEAPAPETAPASLFAPQPVGPVQPVYLENASVAGAARTVSGEVLQPAPLTGPLSQTNPADLTAGTVERAAVKSAQPDRSQNGREAIPATQGPSLPGETAVRPSGWPGLGPSVRTFERSQPATAPGLFNAAIPASLLDNTYAAGGSNSEIRRLPTSRASSPLATVGWAGKLAALRHNPGIESRQNFVQPARVAGVEPGNPTASAWSATGAGVYYDRRQVRRTLAGSEAVEAAVETQDRIFSLAGPAAGLGNFQPQFVQSLAVTAPVQPLADRLPDAASVSTPPVSRTVAGPAADAISSQDQTLSSLGGPVASSPTALQRVFKRLDLDEPGPAAFGEPSELDFASLPLNYAPRTGLRPQRNIQTGDAPGFYETARSAEYVAESFARPVEPLVSVPGVPASPDAARVEPEVARETRAETRPATPAAHAGRVEDGETSLRREQAQYFANSLEATWLSPENRLLVERLPGGSSALQRLRQSPGLGNGFLETFSIAAASNLNLPSLRNNPGLSASVARALEDGTSAGGTGLDSWSGSPALNFSLRRQSSRPTLADAGDFEGGMAAPGAFDFAPAHDFTNAAAFPAQPQPTPNFTISGGLIAQLQRRLEGLAISPGPLSETTGQIMRLLTTDGAAAGSSFGAFGLAAPGFNYTVPPLLWRKVSDYAPSGDLPANPTAFGDGPTAFTYTSPGEVLRAYAEGESYPGRADEGTASAPAEKAARPAIENRLDLPRLELTHRLLQRIASLEKSNTSLELAHRIEAASQAAQPQPTSYAQPGQTPLSLGVQRQPEALRGVAVDFGQENSFEGGERAVGPTPPASLPMIDVPVNRPGAESRFLGIDPGLFADDDFARPAPTPEIRAVEVRVPDRPVYPTPLETAAARSNQNGPNIGQGEILQPLALQRKASVGPGQAATFAPLAQPALHNIIKTSVGRSLDHPVQRKMTDIFGAHFQDVRVHTGDAAAQATRHVGAEAFTLGSDIYFAPGRYQPHSQAGQALIGHELTHVMQQSNMPSLGNGRVPETSSLGQTLEHHAIANEQLLLRHLSSSHDDHDHHNHYHGFSSDESGRLSFRESSSGVAATVERSYQPLSEQNSHPPIRPAHLRNEGVSSPAIQRFTDHENVDISNTGGSVDVNDIIENQENMEKLARRVYQIMRDELMIERERGFGPGNGKFF